MGSCVLVSWVSSNKVAWVRASAYTKLETVW